LQEEIISSSFSRNEGDVIKKQKERERERDRERERERERKKKIEWGNFRVIVLAVSQFKSLNCLSSLFDEISLVCQKPTRCTLSPLSSNRQVPDSEPDPGISFHPAAAAAADSTPRLLK
jgi:hypothetical protein